jgi:hypothetical protein
MAELIPFPQQPRFPDPDWQRLVAQAEQRWEHSTARTEATDAYCQILTYLRGLELRVADDLEQAVNELTGVALGFGVLCGVGINPDEAERTIADQCWSPAPFGSRWARPPGEPV